VETLDAREIALSDAPLGRRLAAGLGPRRQLFDGWRDRRRLFDADVGLSAAQWGIAETGSLVLDSSREKHRLVSLVPPVHVAVLCAQDILGSLGEAFAVAHSRPGGVAPTLTLVTGPSRTADIELTLVIGVHGPRELHVILMESDR
jgi:L-lactate dehydrogenase complex protein LldG